MKLVKENINDLFKPKSEEEIIRNIKEKMFSSDKSVGIIHHLENIKKYSPWAQRYFNMIREKYGNHFFIIFPDDYPLDKILDIFNLFDINYKIIGHTTFLIDDYERKIDLILTKFIKEFLKRDLEYFAFEKEKNL